MSPQEYVKARAIKVLMLYGVFAVGACGGGGVSDTPAAPNPPTDTTTPPTVQRAAIMVRVVLDPADASVAQQAGVEVSGLEVRLTSTRAGQSALTAVTSSDGTVQFRDLLEGVYTATVERRLSAVEVARLAPADREASVFAAGGQVVLAPPVPRSVEVALVAARRGSLVISEVFDYWGPPESGFTTYGFGSYVELYNNSDTTVYLDGLALLKTPPTWHGSGVCDAEPRVRRLDSALVYTGSITAFPGSGRNHPVLPGEARVVAMDAINHVVAAPEKLQVDLSRAHFEEFWTEGDVDNPEAVNMLRLYGTTAGAFGRGLGFAVTNAQLMLLSITREEISEVSVPNAGMNGAAFFFARVPSTRVLDVLAAQSTLLTSETCTPWTSPRYDRAPAPLRNAQVRKAISRRSLGRTADGREILMRTRNSARDFELAEPLRRSLNK